jgi:hypothetical protein
MKIVKFIIATGFTCITMTFPAEVICQTTSSAKTDTIPNDSYDNFKNRPNYSQSYVVVKSKETGKILYEQNLENGKCVDCYDKLTFMADSCYKKKNYSDAVILYTSAFTLNDNKGKVKHRLTSACSQVKLNNFDDAFENLNKVVFGAKFHNIYEISSNDCFKPLQKDVRWAKLIDGINKNLEEVQKKIKAETPIEQ